MKASISRSQRPLAAGVNTTLFTTPLQDPLLKNVDKRDGRRASFQASRSLSGGECAGECAPQLSARQEFFKKKRISCFQNRGSSDEWVLVTHCYAYLLFVLLKFTKMNNKQNKWYFAQSLVNINTTLFTTPLQNPLLGSLTREIGRRGSFQDSRSLSGGECAGECARQLARVLG